MELSLCPLIWCVLQWKNNDFFLHFKVIKTKGCKNCALVRPCSQLSDNFFSVFYNILQSSYGVDFVFYLFRPGPDIDIVNLALCIIMVMHRTAPLHGSSSRGGAVCSTLHPLYTVCSTSD